LSADAKNVRFSDRHASSATRNRVSARFSKLTIQREVERKNIDAGLSQETEISPLDARLHELRYPLRRDAAGLCDPRHLPACSVRRKVRIEAAGGCRHQLCRDFALRVGVVPSQPKGRLSCAVTQFLGCRSEV